MTDFQPKIRGVALASAVSLMALVGFAWAQTKTVTANRAHMTVNCNGMDVTLAGDSNTITLRGACGTVTVSGNRNAVNATSVQTLEVPGSNNSFRLGKLQQASILGNRNTLFWSKKANKKPPGVSNLGTGNSIKTTL